jgi:hypothetical protein
LKNILLVFQVAVSTGKLLLTYLSKLLPPGLFTTLLATVLSVFYIVNGGGSKLLRNISNFTDGHDFVSYKKWILTASIFQGGPGGVVGVAIGYGLDGPGIESESQNQKHSKEHYSTNLVNLYVEPLIN